MRWHIILLLALIIHFGSPLKMYGEEGFTPWEYGTEDKKSSDMLMSLPAFALRSAVIFFSSHISPVDGDRCPMYPTCAAYSRQAFERHGFIGGMLLTVDRLIHEGNEMDRVPLIKVGERLRFLDNLYENDYLLLNQKIRMGK